jgi:hypothetical protein
MTQEALKRVAEKLRRTGASIPAPEVTGTIEGSVVTGLCIALALVEGEIEALAQETALQTLHNENERLGLYRDAYAEQEPVYHLRQYGDVTKEQLDRYIETGDINPPPPQRTEQEPVAWLSTDSIGERYLCFDKPLDNDPVQPLFTTPPQRTEQGWILVPVTLTNDMTSAMADALEDPNNERSSWDLAENMWQAMLPKVPTPPAAQRTEQNFCPRCGKRTKDIHTCTPPQENKHD